MSPQFDAHLRNRGLFDSGASHWIDAGEEIVTFPLWAAGGGLVGYQRYAWNLPKERSNKGRYFTWISEYIKPLALWGMEYALNKKEPKRGYFSPALIITEGVFDAIRCIQCGFRACAILTATPSRQFVQWFRQLTHGQIVLAVKDNDENNAGDGLDKLAFMGYNVLHAKDIGDLDVNAADEFLHETLANWCY